MARPIKKEDGLRETRYYIENCSLAYQLYLKQSCFSNSELKAIFNVSESTVNRIKKKVLEEMARRGIPPQPLGRLPINISFEVWDVDIAELERKYSKSQKYGLCS